MSLALEIKGLYKTYNNGFEALKGIDLEVQSGDFFALLGPNGAGKSTTISIITSLLQKSQGSVSIFSHSLDHEPQRVKALIGLVPQEFNFNVFEPVQEVIINQAGYYGIARPEAKKRTTKLLHTLDLYDKRHEPMRNLSGGMKRRVMIARALAHQPKLLILDEPSAGVDIEIRRSMWAFLRRVNDEGITIILTTHYLEEAENLCRNIAIIDQGKLIENTSMKHLLQRIETETFVLDLQMPLETAPTISGYRFSLQDPTSLEVEVSKENTLEHLFSKLFEHNIKVQSLRNKSNRLEQLFIDLLNKRP